MATELKLSDRELAIARGEDPDTVGQDTQDTGSPDTGSTDTGSQDAGGPESLPDASSAPEEVSPEQAPEEPTRANWWNDETKELAESYGLSDDDLGTFETEAEFRRAARLFDKQLVSSPSPDASSSSTASGEAGPESGAKAEAKAEAKPVPEITEEDLIDPQKYIDGGWDEEAIAMAKALRKEQEYRLRVGKEMESLIAWKQQFEEHAAEDMQRRAAEEFHSEADRINQELFGQVYDESGTVRDIGESSNENRMKLWDAYHTLREGIISRAESAGEQPKLPSNRVLMERAFNLAFPDHKAQQRIEAVKAQSAKRRSVGSKGASQPRTSLNSDDPSEIANHPELVAFWNKAQEVNGVR